MMTFIRFGSYDRDIAGAGVRNLYQQELMNAASCTAKRAVRLWMSSECLQCIIQQIGENPAEIIRSDASINKKLHIGFKGDSFFQSALYFVIDDGIYNINTC